MTLILSFLLVCNTAVYGDVQTGKNPSFQWITSIASENDLIIEKSFFRNLADIIFGSEVKKLYRPVSVLGTNSRQIWITDQASGKIVTVDRSQGIFEFISEPALPLNSLVGLCKTDDGNLFFTDSESNTIFRITKDEISPFISADSIDLNRPTGIAYNKTKHNIWVVETGQHRISVFDLDGNRLKTIGKRGVDIGEFNYPTFIWIDDEGLIYIVDAMNFRIQILDQNTSSFFAFGEAGDASGYFAHPKGIATDKDGNIYVADALFNTIQVFDKKGRYLGRIGSKGTKDGEFLMPTNIFIDNRNFLYVADSNNGRIQVFKIVI